ncbi:MAG TPA: GNAT family N-acetyltransferase [Candidatus Limnocylindrales bacterium]|jgi:ribosomal protein S18 acetylase RimI-like enzyme
MTTIDSATMRRLTLHEAQVHAMPGREVRDLGDAILLHDPIDPEPFWNRIAAVRWPSDPVAFDRRLTEMLVLFASLGRQPHVWASPLHDRPVDLVERLTANGFRDTGEGSVMVLADPAPAEALVARPLAPGVAVERLSGIRGRIAAEAASAIVEVLADAFDVGSDRRLGVTAETISSLARPTFTHYLARWDGRPVAVARRATFDGISYLSSIGTAAWGRGNGFGRLVTAVASSDAVAAGSEWTHLGVFADNRGAIRLYGDLGFDRVGEACPDLLLI